MQPIEQTTLLPSPLWQYLTQHLFSSKPIILNPFQFWKRYNLQRLEYCWSYDPIQLLENCWLKELKRENPSSQSFQN